MERSVGGLERRGRHRVAGQRRLWVVAAAALLWLLAGCSGVQSGSEGFVAGNGNIAILPLGNRPLAPQLDGVTLNGDSWSSNQVTGKVIVYNVWGSWCSPCRAEAPALAAASRRTADKAVFMGLNTRDNDKAAPQAFARAFEVPYDSLYDPGGVLLLRFSGQLPPSAIPSTLVVDLQGRVAARIIGETTEATLVGLIEDVVAGK